MSLPRFYKFWGPDIWHLGETLVCLVKTSNVFYTENKSLVCVESSVVRFPTAKILTNWLCEV